MEEKKRIGVVKESDSAEFPIAVVHVTEKIYPSSFVVVENEDEQILALVLDVWADGGVFTRDTAGFHLNHLNETDGRKKSTHKIVRLRPIARIKEGRLSGENERILIFPGSTLICVSFDQLVFQEDETLVSR